MATTTMTHIRELLTSLTVERIMKMITSRYNWVGAVGPSAAMGVARPGSVPVRLPLEWGREGFKANKTLLLFAKVNGRARQRWIGCGRRTHRHCLCASRPKEISPESKRVSPGTSGGEP